MIYVFVFLMSISNYNLDDAIKRLNPEISTNQLAQVSSVISKRASLYGFTQLDYPLIISMIKKESNFSHIYGAHGEVGMLQVIPEDSHILEIVAQIKCEDGEKYCSEGVPDVRTDGKLNSFKVRRFISLYPKYALEVGFGEMRYWKDQYNIRLKRQYWTKFPEWYLKQRIKNYTENENKLKWWWNNLMAKVGDEYIWISHYNWGNRMSTALSSRNYALSVMKIKNQLDGG